MFPSTVKPVGLVVALLVLGSSGPASACKCGEPIAELSEDLVVFEGTAVESLDWHDGCAERTRWFSEPRVINRLGRVTRFRVHASLELDEDVIVHTDTGSHCAAHFRVGQSHVVTARRIAGILTTNVCLRLAPDVRASVVASLQTTGVEVMGEVPQLDCVRPTSVAEANAKADGVLWADYHASCLVPGTDVVQHAATVRESWKGPRRDELVVIAVHADADEQLHHDPIASSVGATTGHGWPPALFLRRDRNVYVDDGCLTPSVPQSVEAGVADLARSLPRTAIGRSNNRRLPSVCEEVPVLECAELGLDVFSDAAMRLSEHFRALDAAEARDRELLRTGPPPVSPPRSSCAGCSVPYTSDWNAAGLIVVALASSAWARRAFGGAGGCPKSRQAELARSSDPEGHVVRLPGSPNGSLLVYSPPRGIGTHALEPTSLGFVLRRHRARGVPRATTGANRAENGGSAGARRSARAD